MDEELPPGEVREEGQEEGGLRLGIAEAVQRQRDEKKKEVKPRKPVKILRVEDFIDKEKGLLLLYREMKKKNERLCKLAEVQPEKALQDYMSTVREWAFNLAPKYEFDYFVDRVQNLGRKKELTDEMNQLRRYHKGELYFNKETKELVSKDQLPAARITLEEDNPKRTPASEHVQLTDDRVKLEPAVPERDQNYDPTKDPDRALESFIDPDQLAEYSIKKKVKVNDSPGKRTPGSKVKMDIEGPL